MPIRKTFGRQFTNPGIMEQMRPQKKMPIIPTESVATHLDSLNQHQWRTYICPTSPTPHPRYPTNCMQNTSKFHHFGSKIHSLTNKLSTFRMNQGHLNLLLNFTLHPHHQCIPIRILKLHHSTNWMNKCHYNMPRPSHSIPPIVNNNMETSMVDREGVSVAKDKEWYVYV